MRGKIANRVCKMCAWVGVMNHAQSRSINASSSFHKLPETNTGQHPPVRNEAPWALTIWVQFARSPCRMYIGWQPYLLINSDKSCCKISWERTKLNRCMCFEDVKFMCVASLALAPIYGNHCSSFGALLVKLIFDKSIWTIAIGFLTRVTEDSKSSRERFEKNRVNAVLFWYFGILGGFGPQVVIYYPSCFSTARLCGRGKFGHLDQLFDHLFFCPISNTPRNKKHILIFLN